MPPPMANFVGPPLHTIKTLTTALGFHRIRSLEARSEGLSLFHAL